MIAIESAFGAAVKTLASEATTGGGDTLLVYLIEDNRLVRDSTAAMLRSQGVTLAGTARSGEEALQDLERARPKVVLLNAALADGVSVVERLQQAFPEVGVIVTNFPPIHAALVAFIRAGVAGFSLKDATVEEIVGAIRWVVGGAPAIPRALGHLMFSHWAAQPLARAKRDTGARPQLTGRERDVLRLISDGLSNREIADRLNVATHTVKSHVHGVLEKLGLRTRLEVAAYAHAEAAEG
jgi:DNA-binding NarL/FixJ family response regulator